VQKWIKNERVFKFQNNEMKIVQKRMLKDLVLLSNFGLMDYSLLTVVAFNPKYVELH